MRVDKIAEFPRALNQSLTETIKIDKGYLNGIVLAGSAHIQSINDYISVKERNERGVIVSATRFPLYHLMELNNFRYGSTGYPDNKSAIQLTYNIMKMLDGRVETLEGGSPANWDWSDWDIIMDYPNTYNMSDKVLIFPVGAIYCDASTSLEIEIHYEAGTKTDSGILKVSTFENAKVAPYTLVYDILTDQTENLKAVRELWVMRKDKGQINLSDAATQEIQINAVGEKSVMVDVKTAVAVSNIIGSTENSGLTRLGQVWGAEDGLANSVHYKQLSGADVNAILAIREERSVDQTVKAGMRKSQSDEVKVQTLKEESPELASALAVSGQIKDTAEIRKEASKLTK